MLGNLTLHLVHKCLPLLIIYERVPLLFSKGQDTLYTKFRTLYITVFTMTETGHTYQPTQLFRKKLSQLKASDPVGYKRINKTIERLLIKPEDADGKMHGLYNGRLKKYVGRRDYRLIYYWCNLCRKENTKREKNCHDCLTDCGNCQVIPDNSVIFFDLYHKKDMKKFKRNTATPF